MIILLFVVHAAFGQAIDSVSVSVDKTVYVLFGSDVTLVDLGTRQDYAYQVKENIVMLKALRENVKPTSLMVKTQSEIYVCIIKYRREPLALLIDIQARKKSLKALSPVRSDSSGKISENITSTQEVKSTVKALPPINAETRIVSQRDKYLLTQQPDVISRRASSGNRDVMVKDELMQGKIYRIFSDRQNFRDKGEIGNGIYFSLHDLCVDNQFLYIKMSLFNTSSIAFDLDLVYFERNQGKSFKKREAYSNTTIPVVFRESVFTVQPSVEEIIVFVLDLFAYQEKDKLMVKVNERGGVRSLQFFIPAKEIVNAKSL